MSLGARQQCAVVAEDVTVAQEDLVRAVEQLYTAQLNLTVNTILIAPHGRVVTAISGTVGEPSAIRVNIAPAGIGSAGSGMVIR
jgi:multidrug resistance efflux pump